MKVAFLTRYDRTRGSSRVRVYDYLPYLQRMGLECRVLPFPQKLSLKAKVNYVGQAINLSHWADVVVLQKLVIGKVFLSMLTTFRKKIVFDFDDAIYTPPDKYSSSLDQVQEEYQEITKRLEHILEQVNCAIVGSNYLADYAKSWQQQVYVLPSSIDLENLPVKVVREKDNPVVLGWIGSPENLEDFQPIQKALVRVSSKLREEAILKIVSSKPLVIDGVSVLFDKWSLDREREYLHSFDIGLMPLQNTERSRGRCAFKAIQYMGAGLPAIASPVGTALDVVEHNKTGLIASSTEEWIEAISKLVENPELRYSLGQKGRQIVEQRYSIQGNSIKLAEILQQVVENEQ
jgi:glycosyltransferase involved in cell wall biosynthesis